MRRRTIWSAIFAEAWRKSLRDLGLNWAWSHPMIPVLIFAIYVLLVWTQISAEEATLEIKQRFLWVAAPLVVMPVWYWFRLLLTIPDREIELKREAEQLIGRLTPLVTIGLLNSGRAVRWLTGATNRSLLAASKTPLFAEDDKFLGLECCNRTDTFIENCSAHLIALRPESGEPGDFVESIDLEWLLVGDTPDHYAQFPPGACRRLMVVRVVGERGSEPMLYGRRLPSAYQRIFDQGGNFIGRILVRPGYGQPGATLTDFRIRQDGSEPTIEILGAPMAVDTDRLLETGLRA